MDNPSNEKLRQVLTDANIIAVVGLSDRPDRTSYQIAKAMQQVGYRIIPVNPHISETLGEKSYASLADVQDQIDIVNVFRKSEYLPDIARQVIEIGAPVFWAQQGVYNEEAYKLLKENNVTTIMNQCIKVVHSVIVGRQ